MALIARGKTTWNTTLTMYFVRPRKSHPLCLTGSNKRMVFDSLRGIEPLTSSLRNS